MKMIDTEKLIKSLKNSWIKRILDTSTSNNGIRKQLYMKKLNKFGGKLLFESNIKKSDIAYLFPDESFLQNILLSWIDIKGNLNEDNISQEIIWNNSTLKAEGKTFYYKSWYDRGIKLIEHIYDYRKKDFYNFRDFSNLYQIPNADFFKYNSILSSIPRCWKLKLKEENINTNKQTSILEKVLKSKHVNKLLYSVQLNRNTDSETKSEKKWQDQFQNIRWKVVFTYEIYNK